MTTKQKLGLLAISSTLIVITYSLVPLSQENKDYNCKLLKPYFMQKGINYCIAKKERPIQVDKDMVMGEYEARKYEIRLPKEYSSRHVVHEFGHHLLHCYRQTKNEEKCVLEMQVYLEQLNIIK